MSLLRHDDAALGGHPWTDFSWSWEKFWKSKRISKFGQMNKKSRQKFFEANWKNLGKWLPKKGRQKFWKTNRKIFFQGTCLKTIWGHTRSQEPRWPRASKSLCTPLPRQQKFRAMNGAHLACPIRGELTLCSLAPVGLPNSLPYWEPNLGPI